MNTYLGKSVFVRLVCNVHLSNNNNDDDNHNNNNNNNDNDDDDDDDDDNNDNIIFIFRHYNNSMYHILHALFYNPFHEKTDIVSLGICTPPFTTQVTKLTC